ncbi:MAG: sulfurtransferase-like selenium metabolism protein YedF [Anaerolineae bacterium]
MSEVVILVTNSGLGNAEKGLREKMMGVFLSTLDTFPQLPGKILFYTDGVKLVVEGSPVIGELKALEEKGVHLIACGTCLDYFGLKDQVVVGEVGGMAAILEAMIEAEKVLSV